MTFTQVSVLGTIHHCKNQLVVSTTECLPWLQTTGETVVMGGLSETNCIRQPKGQLPSSSYNHNTLITSVLPSPGYMLLTATLKCICSDSFTDVLRVVSVLCQLVCNHSNHSVVKTRGGRMPSRDTYNSLTFQDQRV